MQGRILIVDDEDSIRDTLEIILSEAGFDVATAPDGQTAISLVHAADFDVAVVDRILPNSINGEQIIREIKKLNPRCETVLMSAYPSFESAAQIMEHQTFAYLTKPIQQDEICKVVAEAAMKSRTKHENERVKAILQGVFNASPNPIIVYDSQLRIQFVNPAFTNLFGYSSEQVLGNSIMLVPEAEEPVVVAELQGLLCGKDVTEREQVMLRRDGSAVHTSRIVSLCADMQRDGAHILVIVRDITGEIKMQAQVMQAEKLSLLGELASKLAHEIKNPLQIISGYTELLQRGAWGVEISDRLAHISEAVRRIEKLTSSLLFVAKPKPLCITSFAPEQPLDKAVDFLMSMGQKKYLSVKRYYTCAGELIEGDENQLEQVFMNLIVNASHAVEGRHEQVITLSTQADHVRGVASISVSDTGCGIDSRIQDKIFEPFFTTKALDKGNGLGLSVVKQIVERHGGTIAVASEPGSGSTFTVSLPLKKSHAAVAEEKSA